MEFARRVEVSIDCVADQHEYALSSYTGIQAVISVEYPEGEDPMEYLEYRRETDPRGFWTDGYYCVRGDDPPATLVIGAKPSTGETIGLTYLADHTALTADNSVLTVPDRHLEGLVLFVRWKAECELAIAEGRRVQSRSPTDSFLREFGLAERAARSAYLDWLGVMRAARAGVSVVLSWDRIGL